MKNYYDFVNRYAIIETNGTLVKEAVKEIDNASI